MLIKRMCQMACMCLAVSSVFFGAVPVAAQTAQQWCVQIWPVGPNSVIGAGGGIDTRAKDGYDGGTPLTLRPESKGVEVLLYRENGPEWSGPTGFYGGDYDFTPIVPGGSKTWSEFYLWAQNYTPVPANLVSVSPRFPDQTPPPSGYRGHLVLDYVPDSCNWTGPMDYWVDLTTYTELALPIPITTDPLQGTKMHLTVYAPVPEPSSLAALATGLAGVGGFVFRRRRV